MTRIELIDSPVPVLWLRYSGVLTLDDRHRAIEETARRALAANCFRVLADFRTAHSFVRDDVAGAEVSKFLMRQIGTREMRIAFLVQFDHQLDDVVERALADSGFPTARFSDFDKALAWLRGPLAADRMAPTRAPRERKPKPRETTAQPAASPAVDAVALVARAADPGVRLLPAQYAAAVRMAEDLGKSGMLPDQIQPLVRRMLAAMDPSDG